MPTKSAVSAFAIALAVSTGALGGTEVPCVTHITGEARHAAKRTEELKFDGSTEKVAIHRGHGGTLARGFTVLDQPVTFLCHDASGCLLNVLGIFASDGTFGSFMCVFIDDKLTHQRNSEGLYPLMEAQRVTAGAHVLQSQIWAYNPGTLGAWQINYTMYDEPAPH